MNSYLSDTEFAMKSLFKIISKENTELEKITSMINELQNNLNKIMLQNDYPSQDDLEPKGFFMNRQGFDTLRHRQNKLLQMKKVYVDKDYSINVLYGAILQIAKQGISTVYGDKLHRLLKDDKSKLSLETIIYQARNQALHFEENSPRNGVKNCFKTLQSTYGDDFDISDGENKAKKVTVEVLKWFDYPDYEKTMQDISRQK
jgi:hypothetical protein